MSTGSIEKKVEAEAASKGDSNEARDLESKDVLHDEVLANPDLMEDAFEGENLQHSEGLWAAAKAHPKSCFWAFIMAFTIVSFVR